MPEQITFGNGLDAVSAPHVLPDGAVQAALNVDFSLEHGAARVRRGCGVWASVGGTSAIKTIYRHYSNAMTIDNSPFYITDSAGVTRSGTLGTATWSKVVGTADGIDRVGYGAYRDYVYIANGTKHWKTNGTTVTEWIKQSPPAPTVTTTYSDYSYIAGTYSCSEGTYVGGGIGTATGSTDGSTNRLAFLTSNFDNNDLSTLYTFPVGLYGVDFLDISFSNPSAVTRVSWDMSIDDATFTSYYHAEADSETSLDVTPEAEKLLQDLATIGTSTVPLNDEERQDLISRLNTTPVVVARTRLVDAKNVLSPWGVKRTDWSLVGVPVAGTVSTNPWAYIYAARVVVEATEPITVTIADMRMAGSEYACLNDTNAGYVYWQTFASVDSDGNVIGESAPSPPSAPVQCRFAYNTVDLTGTATGTMHGVTHRVFYRQGGLSPTPYAIATVTNTAASFVDHFSDIAALTQNHPLQANIWSAADWPGDVCEISEPYYDRLFLAYENNIAWTAPGTPDVVPKLSVARVSHQGDQVQKLIVWDRLVIVNRDSIYELAGDVFEGPQANWTLQRSGSRKGAKAPRTVVKTDYGIPLLDYDGISMYLPGRGVDTPLDWAMNAMADSFRGAGTGDPAALKGSRMPAINHAHIHTSVAAYADEKLYLGCPTGTATVPNTVFVLDFRAKQVWPYVYPFSFTSLFWDCVDNRLLAGTTDGKLMRLEWGSWDYTTGAAPQGIPFSIKTRAWTAPSDAVLENIAIESVGQTGTLNAYYDNGTASTLGTLASATKSWTASPLSGTLANNAVFEVAGTQGTGTSDQFAVYGLKFDALVEPQRVTFLQTEYETPGTEQQWDVQFTDIDVLGTGTVFGTAFIDGTAIMTQTILGPTARHQTFPCAFPAETYGYVAYTVYTSTASGTGPIPQFKHYKTWRQSRPEPPRVTSYVSDRDVAKNEYWWQGAMCDMNPLGGTVVATAFVENTAVMTYTLTGNGRSGYSQAFPAETYGDVGYVKYQAAAGVFKHYRTWYDYAEEPDRLTYYGSPVIAMPSENYLKTWNPEINPLGGLVIGYVYVDGTQVSAHTMTGTLRKRYEFGIPNITSGKTVSARMYSSTVFKRYEGQGEFEFEPKPFNKTSWLVTYRRPGGATQLDVGRFYDLDIEGTGVNFVTSVWDIDGTAFSTNTFVVTGRQYFDRVPFPPGARGYLFQQRISCSTPVRVWKSNLDIERVGIKGLSRVTYVGTPNA